MSRAPDAAIELERWMARRRTLESRLLTLDAYRRWGARTDEDHATAAAEESALGVELREGDAALAARVQALRVEDPDAIARWCEAHVALLDHYVAALGDDESKRTERFVAAGERAEWLQVLAGARAFADENVYYVRFDPALYEASFGFPPGGT